jgi:hypothetical protein
MAASLKAQGTVRLGGSVCLGPSPAWCLRVACDSSGDWPRWLRAFLMIRPRVHGGAGLAPAAGLIRSLSALLA